MSPAPSDLLPGPVRARHRRAFVAVAAAFLVTMAFSTAPSPLYGLYQQRDGFSSFVVTVVYAGYAAGVIGSLVLAGHLSDRFGRRKVLLVGLVLCVTSVAAFLLWESLAGLIVGRLLNGIAVGIVSATATAYLAELLAFGAPAADPQRAHLIAAVVNLGGLGVGALVTGALAAWTDAPLSVPFLLFLVAFAGSIAVVAGAPETHRPARPLPPYRPQRVSVPPEQRPEFFAAAAGAFFAYGVVGLFTGLTGVFLAEVFGHTSPALAGAVLALLFGGAVLSQLSTARWPLPRVLASGAAAMVTGLLVVVVAVLLPTPSLALFLTGGGVAGAGAGAVFKGTVSTVASIAPPETRAEALSGIFLAGFLGLSVPVVGAGLALQVARPETTLTVFACVVVTALLLATPRLVHRSAPPVTG